jgi:RNA recognition motif-containing protein
MFNGQSMIFFSIFCIGKIFVARLSETITADDLKEHFEKFGPVTDVYIPKPFRSFAFVTFQESKIAQSLFGKDHLIKGVSVHIGSAQPRMKQGHDQHGGGGGGGTYFFSSNSNVQF